MISLKYKHLFLPKDKFDIKTFANEMKTSLAKLDFLLGGTPFLTGESLRATDFGIYEICDLIRCLDEETFKSFPNIVIQHNSFRMID